MINTPLGVFKKKSRQNHKSMMLIYKTFLGCKVETRINLRAGENDKKLPQLRQTRQKTTKTFRFDT
jgi:hypothetical protein